MDEPRLKAKLRVQAMLRQAQQRGSFGAVLRRGDPDAGTVLVVLRGAAGLAVFSQTRNKDGALTWLRGSGDTPLTQDAADAYVARQVGYDSDLWVVEFDAPDLTLPFEP
jgi:hypothetical protein